MYTLKLNAAQSTKSRGITAVDIKWRSQ